jgi:hypothetical protein
MACSPLPPIPKSNMTTPIIRIYIKDGLVQHVHAPASQPVRIIDCDTEGAPDDDLSPLSREDESHRPEGIDATRAFITDWRNGEAVSRG